MSEPLQPLSKEEREFLSGGGIPYDSPMELVQWIDRALATIDQMEQERDATQRGLETITEQFQLRALKLAKAEQRQQKLVETLKNLEHQVRISNAIDDHGHEMKNLKALADATEALREIGEQEKAG